MTLLSGLNEWCDDVTVLASRVNYRVAFRGWIAGGNDENKMSVKKKIINAHSVGQDCNCFDLSSKFFF